MSNQLQASQVKWRRLRKLVLTTLFIGSAGGFAVYALGGGSMMLDADGLVTRQTVAVASPWPDARIRQISVRPGDWVEAGQQIAVVDSAAMSRALAELAAEQARVIGRVAQLEARREVVKALLPLAKVAADDTNAYMSTLRQADSNGLALTRSLQQMSAAQVQAMDKLLSLDAEKTSLETEISANQGALQQVSGAYADLQRTYGSGVLAAPASGYVGSHVGMVGEVLSAGTTPVANIYAGQSYVLAYIPENYLFEVDEGQQVSIKGRGRTTTGFIERVLPVTDALPPEFQLPNRVRGRGQLVRIELSQPKDFALDEKVRLTSCYTDQCGLGVSEIIEAAIPAFLRGGNRAVAAAEPRHPAAPAAHQPLPAAYSDVPVISLYHQIPTAPSTGSIRGSDVPLPGIVVEPSHMQGPVIGSIPAPTPPEVPDHRQPAGARADGHATQYVMRTAAGNDSI
ncbi:MAG: multidrug transporter [Hyphomicrobium sp.]